MKGKICSVISEKNFGFIRSENNEKIFFHFSEIQFRGDVKPGIKVEFEYGTNKKGRTAVQIVRQKRKKPKRWDDLIGFIEHAEIDEESRKILLKNLAQFRQQELHILIAGPTGVGKSSTINALFDTEVAEVGYGVDAKTDRIQEWKLDENLYLHDTPGLGDGAAKDLVYKQMIKAELEKKNSDGSAVIDVALIIIDGSHRDMGTSIDLINGTIIPNMEDKSRVLVAINQCDMADGGRGWNKKGNFPDKKLVQRLNEKTESVQRRIKESTGVDVQPIYYSALHKYNISKLLSFIIKCTPVKKRFFYIDNLNHDEQIWRYNDRSTYDYENRYSGRDVYNRYEDLSNEVSDLNQSVRDMEKSIDRIQSRSEAQAEVKKEYRELSDGISSLKNTVCRLETDYQLNKSDLQKSVTGIEKTYRQSVSDLQKSAAGMQETYQKHTSDLKKSVADIHKTYQQEAAELFTEALDEVSREISKGSKTSISFSFRETVQNVSEGISAGAQTGENIGKVIPVIGKGAGRIIGGVIGGVGGLLKSIFR